jgi:hypothetical protein
MKAARALCIATFAAAFIIGCGLSVEPTTQSGSGTETTNALRGKMLFPDSLPAKNIAIRLRPANYLAIGETENEGTILDTITDSSGRFSISNIAPGSYIVEAVGGDGYGLVVDVSFLFHKAGVTDIGVRELQKCGAIEITVRTANIAPEATVSAALYGMQRTVRGAIGERLIFTDAPVGSYYLHITSDRPAITGSIDRVATVHADGRTCLDSVSLPVDYRIDSASIASFLFKQGVEVDSFRRMIVVEDNRIRGLNLDNFGLTTLHASIGELDFLYYLSCDSNALSRIPDALFSLTRLQTLSLNYNPLDSLPSAVGALVNLKSLRLDGSSLKRLPATLDECNLGWLHMRANGLTSIPPEIWQCTDLEYLYLSRNAIDSIPNAIANCGRLKSLHITHNNLAALPDSIGALKNLQHIYAYDNKLQGLPARIAGCERLGALKIWNNEIRELPPSIASFDSLRLQLRNNRLSSLPGNIIQTGIRIDINKNRLCTVPDSIAQWLDKHQDPEILWRESQIGCE